MSQNPPSSYTSPYRFFTYPLLPSQLTRASPMTISRQVAVMSSDYNAPWFLDYQISSEKMMKDSQSNVDCMNVVCQKAKKLANARDIENRQLKEQLNAMTQELQMIRSKKVQDDKELERYKKCIMSQASGLNSLSFKFKQVEEEKRHWKWKHDGMVDKVKRYEAALQNVREDRRTERENFESQQNTSKRDLLAQKTHIEELENQMNAQYDYGNIREATILELQSEKVRLEIEVENYKKTDSNLTVELKNLHDELSKKTNQDTKHREDLKRAINDNAALTKDVEKKNNEISRLKRQLAITNPSIVVRNCEKRHCEDHEKPAKPDKKKRKLNDVKDVKMERNN